MKAIITQIIPEYIGVDWGYSGWCLLPGAIRPIEVYTNRVSRTLDDLKVGDTVEVVLVTHPELPIHAAVVRAPDSEKRRNPAPQKDKKREPKTPKKCPLCGREESRYEFCLKCRVIL